MSLVFPGPELPLNQPRYVPGGRGHVESYFLRANDPARPRALWVKATVLQPLEGPSVADNWFIYFDGEKNRTFAHRETVPLESASFDGGAERVEIRVAKAALSIGDVGHVEGELTSKQDTARWSLDFVQDGSQVGRGLAMLPLRILREGPIPKLKLVTPYPSLRFDGRVQVFGETIDLQGWTGMQGHNWGAQHPEEYAWGQCLFPATASAPEAMVEAFTARILVGPVTTPRISCLVVRRGAHTFRFDRLVDLWRQEASISGWRWTLRMRGSGGEAALTMDGAGQPLACLGYMNPNGQPSYCFNTKLAQVWLHVQPNDGPAFQLESRHGGALEFLRRQPDPSLPDVV